MKKVGCNTTYIVGLSNVEYIYVYIYKLWSKRIFTKRLTAVFFTAR